jgi:hypothetical protein
MNDNRMKNIQNLIESLENAVFADELLKELHTEIYVNNIQINHKLMSKLDSYCGFDCSE